MSAGPRVSSLSRLERLPVTTDVVVAISRRHDAAAGEARGKFVPRNLARYVAALDAVSL